MWALTSAFCFRRDCPYCHRPELTEPEPTCYAMRA
nr:MAG TPA: Rad50 zinc hook motif [Caudoviricetes sp.]